MFRTANAGRGRGDAIPCPESAHPASTSQVKQQTGDFKTNDDFISFDALGDDGDTARGRGRQQNGYRGSDTVVGNGVHYAGGKFAGKRGQKRNISQVLEEEGKEKLKDAVTSTPWATNVDWDRHASAMDQLTAEIKAFVEYISPADHEHEIREDVISDVRRLIMNRWRDASVYAFGSFDTKLYLPTGDIDLVIMSPSIPSIKGQQRKILYLIANQLQQSGIGKDVVVIAKAKVPIVKFVSIRGNFKIDISLNMNNGLNVSQRVRQLFDEVGEKTARALVFLVKTFLSGRNMNEVYTGGLGSYSIICLVVSFLQLHPKLQHREMTAWDNLGVLFLELLEIYGKHYNYDDVGICLSGGGSYYSKYRRGWNRPNAPHLLSIEDPADPTNDISGGSHNILAVRQSLAGAYEVLTAAIYHRTSIIVARIANAQSGIHLPTLSGRAIPGTADNEQELDECRRSLLGSILGATTEMLHMRRQIRKLAGLPDLSTAPRRRSPAPPSQPPPKVPPPPSPRTSKPQNGLNEVLTRVNGVNGHTASADASRESSVAPPRKRKKKRKKQPSPSTREDSAVSLEENAAGPSKQKTAVQKPLMNGKQAIGYIDLVTSSPELEEPKPPKASPKEALAAVLDIDSSPEEGEVRSDKDSDYEEGSRYSAGRNKAKRKAPERVLHVIDDDSDEVSDKDDEIQRIFAARATRTLVKTPDDTASKFKPTPPGRRRPSTNNGRIPGIRKALAPKLPKRNSDGNGQAGSDMELSEGATPRSSKRRGSLSTQKKNDYWSAKGPVNHNAVTDSDSDVVVVRSK